MSKISPVRITPEFVAGLQAHLHHDINVLKLKIEKLEKENKELKALVSLKKQPLFNKTEVVKQVQVDPMVDKWFMNQCEFADNIVDTDGITEYAPSKLQDLFDQFKDWFEDLELDIKQPDKNTFKTSLLAIQEKTPYGLSMGKKRSEPKVNGYRSNPRFNFKVRDNYKEEEDPDFIY